MIQICDALSELHSLERPVIVRDLKPSNILYDNHDPPRFFVSDFGISIRIQAPCLCTNTCVFVDVVL